MATKKETIAKLRKSVAKNKADPKMQAAAKRTAARRKAALAKSKKSSAAKVRAAKKRILKSKIIKKYNKPKQRGGKLDKGLRSA